MEPHRSLRSPIQPPTPAMSTESYEPPTPSPEEMKCSFPARSTIVVTLNAWAGSTVAAMTEVKPSASAAFWESLEALAISARASATG